MARRVSILALAAALLCSAVGCRNCGGRCGWFASRSSPDSCGQLVSRGTSTEIPVDPASGMPLQGYTMPGSVIPGSSGIPNGVPGTQPDMLPYPQPGTLIPPPTIPFAPPSPAPGGTLGTLPPPKSGGVPVSSGK